MLPMVRILTSICMTEEITFVASSGKGSTTMDCYANGLEKLTSDFSVSTLSHYYCERDASRGTNFFERQSGNGDTCFIPLRENHADLPKKKERLLDFMDQSFITRVLLAAEDVKGANKKDQYLPCGSESSNPITINKGIVLKQAVLSLNPEFSMIVSHESSSFIEILKEVNAGCSHKFKEEGVSNLHLLLPSELPKNAESSAGCQYSTLQNILCVKEHDQTAKKSNSCDVLKLNKFFSENGISQEHLSGPQSSDVNANDGEIKEKGFLPDSDCVLSQNIRIPLKGQSQTQASNVEHKQFPETESHAMLSDSKNSELSLSVVANGKGKLLKLDRSFRTIAGALAVNHSVGFMTTNADEASTAVAIENKNRNERESVGTLVIDKYMVTNADGASVGISMDYMRMNESHSKETLSNMDFSGSSGCFTSVLENSTNETADCIKFPSEGNEHGKQRGAPILCLLESMATYMENGLACNESNMQNNMNTCSSDASEVSGQLTPLSSSNSLVVSRQLNSALAPTVKQSKVQRSVITPISEDETHSFPEKLQDCKETEDNPTCFSGATSNFGSLSHAGQTLHSGPVSYSGSMLTYCGQSPYSGNISHRSDSSTASSHSFAFPILAYEWNSSPVKMPEPDRAPLQRKWKWGFSCFRCKRSTLFD